MEGLGRGFVRTKDDLVRGTEAGLDMAREAARRGLQAADDAAHVMGINRIPVLRQYLWGQVHTGFWNSYEVSTRGGAVPCARDNSQTKVEVEWVGAGFDLLLWFRAGPWLEIIVFWRQL